MSNKNVKTNPIPKSNLRQRKGFNLEWMKDENGLWVIRKESYTKTLDTVLRKWIVTETEISWLKPKDLGYVKRIEFDIIVQREGYTNTMQKRIILALQHMKAEIPDIEEYKGLHLKYTKPTYYKRKFSKGAITLSEFQTQITQKLSVGADKRIKPIGKERLITEVEAKKLLKNCLVLGIFSEVNNRLSECAGFWNLT